MWFPKSIKFKKQFRGCNNRIEYRTIFLNFGNYGIKAMENKFLNDYHIENIRKFLKKNLKNKGIFWIRIFPHLSRTSKPKEVRMGNGVGEHEKWSFFVKRGYIIFEFKVDSEILAKKIFREIKKRLPMKVRLIRK